MKLHQKSVTSFRHFFPNKSAFSFPRRFSIEELIKDRVLAFVILIGAVIIVPLNELACALCASLYPHQQQRRGDFKLFNLLSRRA